MQHTFFPQNPHPANKSSSETQSEPLQTSDAHQYMELEPKKLRLFGQIHQNSFLTPNCKASGSESTRNNQSSSLSPDKKRISGKSEFF